MPNGRMSSAEVPIKPMRKGTHSCFQCRRRKKRCIFSAGDSVCITCRNKGFECVAQTPEQLQDTHVDSRLRLKDRVAKLEAIIHTLGSDIPSTKENPPLPSTPLSFDKATPDQNFTDVTTNPSVPQDNSEFLGPDIGQKIGPVSSIFDNAIWRSSESDQNIVNSNRLHGVELNSTTTGLDSKHSCTREALLFLLPAPQLLGDILNATASWWHSWRPLGHSISEKRFDSLRDFVYWALKSEDPSVIGQGILCISVSVQQLNADENETLLRRLSDPPGVLVHKYLSQIEALIVNDTSYASTKEGISVTLMLAKTLMNLGAIKKTWILYHKAIAYCQLLGLHKPSRLHEGETDSEVYQRHSFWVSICSADVYLSLLLGLPHAADFKTIPNSFYGNSGTVMAFTRDLLRLSVQVIDRNQMGLSGSTDLANSIQTEMETSAQAMPQEFWECDVALVEGRTTKAEYFELITSQFWYHQLKVFLHMPLMIQSVEDPALESHRLTCLESARCLLQTYRIMRADRNSAFGMVKVIDYQAFICAALLVLGVLGYGAMESPDQSIQRARDQDLIDTVVDILRNASRTSDNAVALQALQGLETLVALPQMSDCLPSRSDPSHCATPFLRIVVPYSGVIIIGAGEFLQDQRRLKESVRQGFLNAPPTFSLSHGIQNWSHEITNIDFDWAGMIDMQAEDDWAWLSDINGGLS